MLFCDLAHIFLQTPGILFNEQCLELDWSLVTVVSTFGKTWKLL